MKLRYLLAALVLGVLPVTAAHAGIFISIAPPPLLTYEQPLCPSDGYLWTPGYWAYDYDASDYYWVNGVWVPSPRVGYLWTPGYWGFNNGGYAFNEGYWGPTVGFYGGINYGFGYGGYGYGGGRWEGRSFRYNTAITHVNTTIIHNTYVDRNAVRNTTSSRTSFNGGRGGISARPDATQLAASRASHIRATAVQTKALTRARTTHASTARRTATNSTQTANMRRNGGTPNPTRNAGNTVRPTKQITRDTTSRSTGRNRTSVTRNSGRNGFNNRGTTRNPQITRGPQVNRGPRVTRGPQVTRQPNNSVQKAAQGKKDEKKH